MPRKNDFHGSSVVMGEYLTRVAVRQTRDKNPEKVEALLALPETQLSCEQEKRLPKFLTADMITCVAEENGVLWLGTKEGLWRINEAEADELDRVQCFRAQAYMLDNEVEVIEPDGDNGVWVLTKTSVSHIAMRAMSVEHKANLLSEVNYQYTQRRGMLSGGRWDEKNQRWVGTESDNDGLWTSLVAMGDICRYAVMKNDPKYSAEEVEHARKVATRWVEAILLLEYIPSWKGRVPSFVRYNEPGTNRASKVYLKQGKEAKINLPDVSPAGFNFAPLGPVNPDDWAAEDAMPEIVFRNVEGYIARSYHVNDPENDPLPLWDGVFFKKVYNADGKLISVRIPSSSDKGDDLPALLSVDSSMEIPERLRRLYTSEVNPKTGKNWGDDDIIYKCDTSNDELVGHYAIWQLAYDILGEDDPELREIIATIAERHAQHFADNDYAHTDAGGQPTSWARMTREYYMNKDCEAFCDAPLGTMILLQLYKVAHHVTGNERWNEEYRKLALEEPYRYADLACEHYERYERQVKDFFKKPELDSETLFPFVVKSMNYSDTRMAAVAYYTMSQLETDPVLLEKYQRGADCWWRLERYGRDVEWSLVYQLMYPDEEQVDAFGRPCKDVLKWQVSRYPINSRELFIDNTTRPDAYEEDEMLWYKDTETPIPYAVAMDERGATGTDFFYARQGYNGSRHLCESYNLIWPYWMGRYHSLLKEEGKPGDMTLDELMEVLSQD